MSCVTAADCNYRGYCTDSQECDCDPGWFQDNCYTNLLDHHPKAFKLFKVVFEIFFAFIILAVLFRLIFKIMKESRIYSQRKFIIILKGLRSPYNIICILIILLCLTQFLWLVIDPFVYNNEISRGFERFLYEASFIILFIMYAIIFWVWNFIYQEISQKSRKTRRKNLLWVKIGVILFIIFAVVVLIAVSVLKNNREVKKRTAILWLYTILFVVQALFLVAFAIFGVILYRRIRAKERDVKARLEDMGELASSEQGSSKDNLSKELKIKSAKSHANSIPETTAKNFQIGHFHRSNTDSKLNKDKENNVSIQELPEEIPLERLRKATSTVIVQPPKQRNMDEVFLAEPKRVQVIYEEDENEDDAAFDEEIENLAQKLNRKLQRSVTSAADIRKETKIREILKRDKLYFQTLERSELKEDNIATDVPFIVSDVQGVVWDVPDEEDQKREKEANELRQENREALRREIRTIRENPLLKAEMGRQHVPELELYNARLLNDPEYLKHHRAISKSDKAVIKRISGLTILAIFLGVMAAVINLINYLTDTLSTPGGLIALLWITALLLIFALVSVVMLFSMIDSQEKENLRMINRIGKSKTRINKLYAFVLPDYMKEEESKRKLENNINYLTTKHSSFLDTSNNGMQ